MSESASKRQRRAEREEDDAHEEAMMDTDGPQHQQQATASHATHSIGLQAFAQHFSHIRNTQPVVVAYVFSFVSLHLVAALPQRLWRHVGCQITQLVMDTYDTAERRFWCGLSFADAFEWGRQLTRLKSIVVKHPRNLFISRGPPAFIDYIPLSPVIHKVVTASVEGHSEGRRAEAATAAGQLGRGTLESIEYGESGGSTVIVDEDEYRDIRAATEPSVALLSRLDPPPTLTSLTSITVQGYELSYPGRGRHWQLPSLEAVQLGGIVCGDGVLEVLEGLVGMSRCLKELHVECHPDVTANSLAQIPVAAAGQPGSLSQLEDVGTLRMSSASARGLERLQAVLVDRGCRSIKKLSMKLKDSFIDSHIFATLSAIETFARAVSVRPDIPVDISIFDTSNAFDLSLLCGVPTRPEPSPFVQKHIQQLAAKAHTVSPAILPNHTTNPLDTPSPAAIALAQSLTFLKAERVEVMRSQVGLDADPLVIDSMPNNAFPAASSLSIHDSNGHVIARKLLTKMPAVKRIELWHSTEEQAVGVLQAVGGERELECFEATSVTDVGEGGLTWGDMADQLPTITVLDSSVEVPRDLGDGDALASSASPASGRCSRSEASRSSTSRCCGQLEVRALGGWWRSGPTATPLKALTAGFASVGGDFPGGVRIRSLSKHSTPNKEDRSVAPLLPREDAWSVGLCRPRGWQRAVVTEGCSHGWLAGVD
ncbi:unnamed protein product [Vitrella brassicaformis CCMP3155]|uniref:Uncharacterized protein n=1 Tax=Vitrella brassicaformis (strain CCMP3155) TaxID=1169540 RepID=A0A0G4EUI9_VITBC|nr:unnamed protein product [Vitrella brassicaformis CCMP3155]|eukprot:CEM01756.1 unnamed protein product [Vitrella brassicaformis CCMP3155]